jgi:hypothetical protein
MTHHTACRRGYDRRWRNVRAVVGRWSSAGPLKPHGPLRLMQLGQARPDRGMTAPVVRPRRHRPGEKVTIDGTDLDRMFDEIDSYRVKEAATVQPSGGLASMAAERGWPVAAFLFLQIMNEELVPAFRSMKTEEVDALYPPMRTLCEALQAEMRARHADFDRKDDAPATASEQAA